MTASVADGPPEVRWGVVGTGPIAAKGALAGTRRLAEVARERDVFCMEAMWTRFLPVTADLLEVAGSREVGRLPALHAAIGSPATPVPGGRLHDPRQGGGALLDIGVHPVWLTVLLLGPVTSVSAAGEVSDAGVDVLTGCCWATRVNLSPVSCGRTRRRAGQLLTCRSGAPEGATPRAPHR